MRQTFSGFVCALAAVVCALTAFVCVFTFPVWRIFSPLFASEVSGCFLIGMFSAAVESIHSAASAITALGRPVYFLPLLRVRAYIPAVTPRIARPDAACCVSVLEVRVSTLGFGFCRRNLPLKPASASLSPSAVLHRAAALFYKLTARYASTPHAHRSPDLDEGKGPRQAALGLPFRALRVCVFW